MRTEDMDLFTVKVPPELKKAFLEACLKNDTSGSREVREFMRRYIAQHGQGELKI